MFGFLISLLQRKFTALCKRIIKIICRIFLGSLIQDVKITAINLDWSHVYFDSFHLLTRKLTDNLHNSLLFKKGIVHSVLLQPVYFTSHTFSPHVICRIDSIHLDVTDLRYDENNMFHNLNVLLDHVRDKIIDECTVNLEDKETCDRYGEYSPGYKRIQKWVRERIYECELYIEAIYIMYENTTLQVSGIHGHLQDLKIDACKILYTDPTSNSPQLLTMLQRIHLKNILHKTRLVNIGLVKYFHHRKNIRQIVHFLESNTRSQSNTAMTLTIECNELQVQNGSDILNQISAKNTKLYAFENRFLINVASITCLKTILTGLQIEITNSTHSHHMHNPIRHSDKRGNNDSNHNNGGGKEMGKSKSSPSISGMSVTYNSVIMPANPPTYIIGEWRDYAMNNNYMNITVRCKQSVLSEYSIAFARNFVQILTQNMDGQSMKKNTSMAVLLELQLQNVRVNYLLNGIPYIFHIREVDATSFSHDVFINAGGIRILQDSIGNDELTNTCICDLETVTYMHTPSPIITLQKNTVEDVIGLYRLLANAIRHFSNAPDPSINGTSQNSVKTIRGHNPRTPRVADIVVDIQDSHVRIKKSTHPHLHDFILNIRSIKYTDYTRKLLLFDGLQILDAQNVPMGTINNIYLHFPYTGTNLNKYDIRINGANIKMTASNIDNAVFDSVHLLHQYTLDDRGYGKSEIDHNKTLNITVHDSKLLLWNGHDHVDITTHKTEIECATVLSGTQRIHIHTDFEVIDGIKSSNYNKMIWSNAPLQITRYNDDYLAIDGRTVYLNLNGHTLEFLIQYLDNLRCLRGKETAFSQHVNIVHLLLDITFSPTQLSALGNLLQLRNSQLKLDGFTVHNMKTNKDFVDRLLQEVFYNVYNLTSICRGVKYIKPAANMAIESCNILLLNTGRKNMLQGMMKSMRAICLEICELGAKITLEPTQYNQPANITDGIVSAGNALNDDCRTIIGVVDPKSPKGAPRILPLYIADHFTHGITQILLGMCNTLNTERKDIVRNKYKN